MKRGTLKAFVEFVKLNLFRKNRPVHIVPRTCIVVAIFWNLMYYLCNHFLIYLRYFEKKNRLDITFLSVCLNAYTPNQLLKAWIGSYETWYEYHGKWAHLNDMFHRYFPLVIPTLQPIKLLRRNLIIAWNPVLVSIHETWYVYYTIWYHLKGVVRKSLRSVIPTL